jgi:hypothetical protein
LWLTLLCCSKMWLEKDLEKNAASLKKSSSQVGTRATRLGEFCPIGQFFSLGRFMKSPVVARKFWATFFQG